MKYQVKVRVYVTEFDYVAKRGTILSVPFHWKKISKYCKGFEPTATARKMLDQFKGWDNLDIDTPTNQLPIIK